MKLQPRLKLVLRQHATALLRIATALLRTAAALLRIATALLRTAAALPVDVRDTATRLPIVISHATALLLV